MILISIAVVLLVLYALLIIAYWIGWRMIPTFKMQTKWEQFNNQFSIIVPARNEEHSILACLQSLTSQSYSAKHFQIIVVNDHSTDKTQQVVEAFIAQYPTHQVSLINMADEGPKHQLKKAAITYAINKATSKFIVLTDADCTRGTNWLNTINQFLNATHSKFVYAPVEFNANTVFEKIQALEFAGLVGIGASAIQLKNPNMCSAANLIFDKEVFFEVDGYTGNDGLASGDDEFLLHKVFKVYPNNTQFLKHADATVFTTANASVHQLAQQRKRWVSKSTKYDNRYITAILVGAYLFNASVLILLIVNPIAGLCVLAGKTLVEALFLGDVMRFFKHKSYLLFLPLAELFHIIYVLIIGIWANVGTYTWKERDLN